MKIKKTIAFNENELDRIIEMAWEDRTSFDTIKNQFGINEKDVIKLMRKELKEKSFKMWRRRVQGRITKHSKMSSPDKLRFKSNSQRQITLNKISKRIK
tara:strand:- start:1175 stop:1471 length:297 start_codon:yes stop_codon:yes gene_type:complete